MMDLFVINRYDESKIEEDTKGREAKILEKLQKSIEKKKRKVVNENASIVKEDNQQNELIEESIKNDEVVKKKKKKKDKTRDTDNNEIQESDEVNVEEEKELDIEDDTLEKESKQEDESFPFTILGEQKYVRPQPIQMVLPHWLANPEILQGDLSKPGLSVKELDCVCDIIKKNLNTMKIKNLFPVQEKLIPWILNVNKKPVPFRPRDVCVSAVTGSGKTLSYAVPIVQHLVENKVECKVTALVLLPVYELAAQVSQVFNQLCNNLKVRSILLAKHRDLALEQNMLLEKTSEGKFKSRVDIIISTGGRLVEHLFYTEGFDLTSLKFLVIDEADHAMSQVHNDWYHHLIQHLGVKDELQSNRLSYRDLMALVKDSGKFRIPQKLLFSATLSQDPEKISAFNLFQPKLYTTTDNKEDLIKYQERKVEEAMRGKFIGKYTTPAELKEFYAITEYKLKPLTLYGLIKKNNWRKFLCFTNTIETSHRLSFVLQVLMGKDLVIEELSSLLPMKIRQKVLHKFSKNEVNGLICSDALSRGIDVADVDAVISYDLPKHLKIYIHRIGRTARAGKEGLSVTIIAPDQIKIFEKMIQTANKKSVHEMKPDREFEEANALNFANAQKKLRQALEVEEKEKKKNSSKSTGLTLFEKLQKQVKPIEEVEIVPESWKTENIQENVDKKLKKKKKKVVEKSN